MEAPALFGERVRPALLLHPPGSHTAKGAPRRARTRAIGPTPEDRPQQTTLPPYVRRPAAGNGAAPSSGSGSGARTAGASKMVPIDVALSRIRGGAGAAAPATPAASQFSAIAAPPAPGASAPALGAVPVAAPGLNGSGVMRQRRWEEIEVDVSRNGAVAVLERDAEMVSDNSTSRAGGTTQQRSRPLPAATQRQSELDGARTSSPKVLPSDETFKWARDSYSTTERTIDVWSFVLTLRARIYLLDAKWTYLGGFSEDKQKQRRRRLAAWVRESILQLGPTFIKLGQLSSARSDLLPAEFVEELSKLQDKVPAFSAEKAIALVERELGQPINALFLEFEPTPIAAASLGQVHRAVLYSGERVVVKVQRPALKELFDIDLGNMKIIAEYFQSSETLGGPSRDWVGIYEECATILYQEIDYINEGRNADRFRRDFRKYPWVRVPEVYWDYTSRKVLTLQYLPGIKINDVADLDASGFSREIIARRAIEAYLIQILRTGFFHADPHPGNLAVAPGNALIYYDFGMMGEIAGFTKDRLLFMFYAVYEKDAKKVVTALIELGALVPTGDLNSVRRSIQFFLDNLTGPKMEREATISAIGEDLFAIAVDQPFRFPATFTFVLRAFTTLEGIGAALDPNFTFAKVAAPYAQELLDVRDAQRGQDYVVQQISKQATEVQALHIAR